MLLAFLDAEAGEEEEEVVPELLLAWLLSALAAMPAVVSPLLSEELLLARIAAVTTAVALAMLATLTRSNWALCVYRQTAMVGGRERTRLYKPLPWVVSGM